MRLSKVYKSLMEKIDRNVDAIPTFSQMPFLLVLIILLVTITYWMQMPDLNSIHGRRENTI